MESSLGEHKSLGVKRRDLEDRMRHLRKAMRALWCGCLSFGVALFVLSGVSLADATAELTYSPGGLVLTANQSVSAGPITLQMRSNCSLTVTNAAGQILWQSSPGQAPCSAPEAAFEKNGNLVISSNVKGQRINLWASDTLGSSKLVLSSSLPYLEIANSDGSPAWMALGSLTLAAIDPPMIATIGARGGLYSRAVQIRPALPIASGDRVDNFQAADGREVQVLVKAPSPKNTDVYNVPPYPMTPHQRVLDYLSGAIAYATGSNPSGTVYGSVVFPKAIYEVEDFPGCDLGRGSNGYQHWEIASITDLTIDGQGSTLNFNGLCLGIEMDFVQRVVFKNFNIDWPKVQLAALATVQNVNMNAGLMDLAVDPSYPIDKNAPVEAITTWDRANNYWSLINPGEDESIPVGKGYTTYLGGQIIRVPDWAGFNNGDAVLVRFFAGEAPAVTVNDSQDFTIESVNVYGASGSGFIFGFDRGIHLVNSQVMRLPGSNRLISVAGDAVHMSGDQGDIIIEGNTIGYQGDDGLNLNAQMWCNSMSSGSNAQPCNSSLAGASGGSASSLVVYDWYENVWVPADAVGFFEPDFFLLGFSKVESTVTNPHVSTELQFGTPSPSKGQFVADLNDAGARYIIRNNSFLHNRARGVLLQTAEGLVEGNTFDGQTLHSIYIISSPYWGEGPGAQNLVVANNQISNVGNYIQNASSPNSVLGAVVVAAEDNQANTISSSAPLHQNVIFSGNTVQDTPVPGFFISAANNVILSHNQLANTNQSSSYVGIYGTATSAGSIVVTHASNVFFQANELSGSSGPVSIDRDSTSGISGLP
jgi:hypothetical protein